MELGCGEALSSQSLLVLHMIAEMHASSSPVVGQVKDNDIDSDSDRLLNIILPQPA